MSNMKVHYSSASNEWETPQALYNWLNDWFNFTLDPCCTKKSAKCAKYYTIKEDGLSKSWAGERVFVNPPYGNDIGKWVSKAYMECLLNDAMVVCLIPARTDTRWFYEYCTRASKIVFLVGRVKFERGGKALGVSAPFPSCIVIFDKDCTEKNRKPECEWIKFSANKTEEIKHRKHIFDLMNTCVYCGAHLVNEKKAPTKCISGGKLSLDK